MKAGENKISTLENLIGMKMNLAKLTETLTVEASANECWSALSAVEQAAYIAAYPESKFQVVADAESERADHTKNPYHKILTQHGFKHVKTAVTANRFKPTAKSTEHLYERDGGHKVKIIQDHQASWGNKPNHWIHHHKQSNGIIAPSHGDTKPQLHKNLTREYGETASIETSAIQPLHLEQDGNPYPHSAATHDALKEHHENQAAKHVNNYPLASAHRQAAQHHDHAANALSNRTANSRMLSQKAHNFSSANNLH